jgi:hypothetical protein
MAYSAQNFRDLLALARLLRRFAQEQSYDGEHGLLLDTASALEVRAFALANAGGEAGALPPPDKVAHAPVDVRI